MRSLLCIHLDHFKYCAPLLAVLSCLLQWILQTHPLHAQPSRNQNATPAQRGRRSHIQPLTKSAKPVTIARRSSTPTFTCAGYRMLFPRSAQPPLPARWWVDALNLQPPTRDNLRRWIVDLTRCVLLRRGAAARRPQSRRVARSFQRQVLCFSSRFSPGCHPRHVLRNCLHRGHAGCSADFSSCCTGISLNFNWRLGRSSAAYSCDSPDRISSQLNWHHLGVFPLGRAAGWRAP